MKEHPILFSGPMVRAILEGQKTQTRRVIKPQPPKSYFPMVVNYTTNEEGYGFGPPDFPTQGLNEDHRRVYWRVCPYGKRGDLLWVRESGMISTDKTAFMYCDGGGALAPSAPKGSESWVREWKPCPSIHMPRWASRITLEIVGVRVERLQQIGGTDAWQEGGFTVSQFINLWNSINDTPERPYGWDVNPWVWVVEFTVI